MADARETRGGSGTLSKLIEIGPHAREAMSPEKKQKTQRAANTGAHTAGTSAGQEGAEAGGGARGRGRTHETDRRDAAVIKRRRKEHDTA